MVNFTQTQTLKNNVGIKKFEKKIVWKKNIKIMHEICIDFVLKFHFWDWHVNQWRFFYFNIMMEINSYAQRKTRSRYAIEINLSLSIQQKRSLFFFLYIKTNICVFCFFLLLLLTESIGRFHCVQFLAFPSTTTCHPAISIRCGYTTSTSQTATHLSLFFLYCNVLHKRTGKCIVCAYDISK